jgi:hypothetical protein
MVLVGGGETATKTGWESAARDDERRCDDPWTLGIDKSGGKKSRSTRGAPKHRVRMQHVTI